MISRGRLTCVALVAGALAITPLATATAVQVAHSTAVNVVPAANTPGLSNGRVEEITQVGTKIFLGGTFTTATNPGSGTAITRNRILAFNATTGVVDTGFAPNFNNTVLALLPGPTANTIYVGGQFTTLNGAAVNKLVLLDTNTGARVASFNPPAVTGIINDFKRSGNRLFLGGTFAKLGGVAHKGLATVNATTGALDPFMNLQVAVNHNWNGSGAKGAIGVAKLDVNPAGTRLVAIGNFKTVNGGDYDQVVLVDISGASAAIANWQTNRYDSRCYDWAFDSWIRDVDFSPDGAYFVVVGTGGYPVGDGNFCDSAARWETAATGTDLYPTWVDWSGGDTLLSVAVTGAAIYTGGHQRWMNNHLASDQPGPGSVPRAGLAALDPVNGLPISWNPGRNPRGGGVFNIYASATGLYLGSDTNYIGPGQYLRKKIAFFPLAGGKPTPPDNTGTLPATIYQAGQLPGQNSYNVLHRVNTGGPVVQANDAGPNWAADDAVDNPTIRNSQSNSAFWGPGASRGAALTASTPTALFDSERWSPTDSPSMQFHFAVPVGAPLTVRLFFANRYGGTSNPGERVFNVALEGSTVLSNYDIVADVGDLTGTMKEFAIPAVNNDGTVNIDFSHVVENPLINGIEIRRTDQADPPASSGGNDLISRTFDGTTAGPTTVNGGTGIAWSRTRGAFMVDGKLFYGWDDGTFRSRTFNGTTFGPETLVDPYNDPVWVNVSTGSGQTYRGLVPGLYGEMPNVTSMFYSKGRLYYTLFGESQLFSRYFTPESGIVGSQRFTGDSGGIDWSDTAGAFLDAANHKLYWASATDGSLKQVGWLDPPTLPVGTQPVVGRPTGAPVTVSAPGEDWRGRGVFNFAG